MRPGQLITPASLAAWNIANIGVASNIVLVDTTRSTNLDAHAPANARPNTLIVANHQVAGRGRHERSWEAPAGSGLTFSLVLQPALPLPDWGLYALVMGYCVVRGIQDLLSDMNTPTPAVSIKWPNDVLVEGKKVAGILCEITQGSSDQPLLIAGIGINTNWQAITVPQEFAARSTALSDVLFISEGEQRAGQASARGAKPADEGQVNEGQRCGGAEPANEGQVVDHTQVLAKVLGHIDAVMAPGYAALDLVSLVTPYMGTLGRRVVAHGTTPIEGTAVRLSPAGHLVIRQASGREIAVQAADVEHLR